MLFTVTLWVDNDKLTRYEGGDDEAKRKREERKTVVQTSAPKTNKKRQTSERPVADSERTERIEREIETLERKLGLLDAAMERESDAANLQVLFAERPLLPRNGTCFMNDSHGCRSAASAAVFLVVLDS